jgi:4-methyl-5(b-hydroxyethyl)-thiazole monophosphate biosynthesis
MHKVLVLLATDFEDLEAVGTISILRRAGLQVDVVSVENLPEVTSARGISIKTEGSIDQVLVDEYEILFLPGGAGHKIIDDSYRAKSIIQKFYDHEKIVSAICAAPSILGKMGLLADKKFTCYPGYEKYAPKGEYIPMGVVTDGQIITGSGVAYVQQFALQIIKEAEGYEVASRIAKEILFM